MKSVKRSRSRACQLFGVSTSGFYAWKKRPLSQRAQHDDELLQIIQKSHTRSRGIYGVRRVHADLVMEFAQQCSTKRVHRLMKKQGIYGAFCKKKWKTTIRAESAPYIPDLVKRDFHPGKIHSLWVDDITYIPTDEGFAYCAMIHDTHSKKVMGHFVHDTMDTDALVIPAFDMAVSRLPKGSTGCIHHSDHGSQYTSDALLKRCKQTHIKKSLGTVGDCYDNAPAESLNATLEKELLRRVHFRTKAEAKLAIFEYLEVFYNRQRRHSSIGNRIPEDFSLQEQLNIH